MHIHDFHATVLHLLGLDHERLTYRYSGRDFRLTDVAGVVRRALRYDPILGSNIVDATAHIRAGKPSAFELRPYIIRFKMRSDCSLLMPSGRKQIGPPSSSTGSTSSRDEAALT
jgi:hypothetical protein